VTRNVFVIDAALAAILTILVLVLAPGWAVVGLIAIVVLLICAISFGFDRLRTRRRRRA
jgi:hypothetical protein